MHVLCSCFYWKQWTLIISYSYRMLICQLQLFAKHNTEILNQYFMTDLVRRTYQVLKISDSLFLKSTDVDIILVIFLWIL